MVVRVALPLVVLASCRGGGDDPAAASTTTAYDSAGIRIVQNRDPARPHSGNRTLEASPFVTIGQVDGEAPYMLYDVRGAVRLSDGRFVVANGGTKELRFYSPSGEYIKRAGGLGDGPGEFRLLSFLSRYRGDSLLVFDYRRQRFSVSAPDGTHERDWQAPAALGGHINVIGATVDGTVFVAVSSPIVPARVPVVSRGTTTVISSDATGTILDTIGVFPAKWHYQGPGSAVGPISFSATTEFAVGVDVLFAGASDSSTITAIAGTGRPVQSVRLSITRRRVTERFKEAERARLRTGPPLFRGAPARIGRFLQQGRAELADAMPFPEYFPAFGPIFATADGYLWVTEFRVPDSAGESTYRVIDPSGRWIGNVRVPAGFEVFEVGSDYVLGKQENELGVERIEAYRLLPAEDR